MLFFEILHLLITSNSILEPMESFAGLIWTLLVTAFVVDLVTAVNYLKGLLYPIYSRQDTVIPYSFVKPILMFQFTFH